MFLFENFAYNNSWASQYYESFYDASEYFMEYLNANLPFNNISYIVSRRWTSDHKNNKYEVTCIDKRDIFKNVDSGKLESNLYVVMEAKKEDGETLLSNFVLDVSKIK